MNKLRNRNSLALRGWPFKRLIQTTPGLWHSCLLVLFVLQICQLAAVGQTSAKKLTTAVVGIKLLKASRGVIAPPLKIVVPSDCPECSVMHGPFYEGQNARESFFYLNIPISVRLLKGVNIEVGSLDVRAVVIEKSYIHFSKSNSTITFDVPVQPRERSSTMELQTNLNWPGLTVRVEHAFKDRAAGMYSSNAWPALQRQAALNLEFGAREAIRALQLDQQVNNCALGRIHLMGFDTNDPLGHEDYPPHIHIILRWPNFAGSQAPHFYLSGDGKIEGDVKVTIDGLPEIQTTTFPMGKPIPTVDYLAEIVFETVVNPDGSLTLRRPDFGSCALRAARAGDQGFASGVEVTCSTGTRLQVHAEDDTETGTLRVYVDSKLETYKYDPDTAVLISSDPAMPSISGKGLKNGSNKTDRKKSEGRGKR
jgi:hypothetical protein